MPESFHRDLLVLIHDLGRMLRTQADRWARQHGMTRAQLIMLARLSRQPGMTQKELAALLEVEPITAARLVDRLQEAGLVERHSDPKDRRIWRLHVMPAARPLLKQIDAYRAEKNRRLAAGLDPEKREQVIEAMLQMKANLLGAEMGEDAGPKKEARNAR